MSIVKNIFAAWFPLVKVTYFGEAWVFFQIHKKNASKATIFEALCISQHAFKGAFEIDNTFFEKILTRKENTFMKGLFLIMIQDVVMRIFFCIFSYAIYMCS